MAKIANKCEISNIIFDLIEMIMHHYRAEIVLSKRKKALDFNLELI